MKRNIFRSIAVFVVSCLLLFIHSPISWAAALEDGVYTVNYEILQGDSDSVSIANDYWEKPARVTVENGNIKVQVTLNHSSWIKEYKISRNGTYRDVVVISENPSADKRTVEFTVGDLSKPVPAKIHVTVPDINYDHDYTIRMSFDLNSLQKVEDGATSKNKEIATNEQGNDNANKSEEKQEKQVDNPPTGDSTMLYWFIALLVISGAFLIWTRKWKLE